jgi:beta-aspartyl-peptidase (threonine type)
MKAIIVHGGAGKAHTKKEIPPRIETCKRAAEAGYILLKEGKSSIDAAITAVKIFENDPLFNAGKGAYLTEKGEVETDAGIMDGKTLQLGAVSGIKHIKNPVELARTVMEKSKHNFLISGGAEEFAMKNGFTLVPNEYFITNRTKKLFRAKVNDTVGAVALDETGKITAAVSTGGTPMKMQGRVGDSPLVGSGFYANSEYGAVATGIGEDIMRAVLTFRIMLHIKEGIEKATNKTIEYLTSINGKAGVIVLDKYGNITFKYNTEMMFYAFMKEGMQNSEGGI